MPVGMTIPGASTARQQRGWPELQAGAFFRGSVNTTSIRTIHPSELSVARAQSWDECYNRVLTEKQASQGEY